MLINILSALAVIVVVAALIFVLYGRERTWATVAGPADQGAFDLTAVQRTTEPHDALMCTQGLCEGVRTDRVLPSYTQPPAALLATLDKIVTDTTALIERVDDGQDPAITRYVTRSNLMRFPDTVWLQAVTMPNGQTGLIAYARAQLGYSDMGANKARLDAWIDQLPAD